MTRTIVPLRRLESAAAREKKAAKVCQPKAAKRCRARDHIATLTCGAPRRHPDDRYGFCGHNPLHSLDVNQKQQEKNVNRRSETIRVPVQKAVFLLRYEPIFLDDQSVPADGCYLQVAGSEVVALSFI